MSERDLGDIELSIIVWISCWHSITVTGRFLSGFERRLLARIQSFHLEAASLKVRGGTRTGSTSPPSLNSSLVTCPNYYGGNARYEGQRSPRVPVDSQCPRTFLIDSVNPCYRAELPVVPTRHRWARTIRLPWEVQACRPAARYRQVYR